MVSLILFIKYFEQLSLSSLSHYFFSFLYLPSLSHSTLLSLDLKPHSHHTMAWPTVTSHGKPPPTHYFSSLSRCKSMWWCGYRCLGFGAEIGVLVWGRDRRWVWWSALGVEISVRRGMWRSPLSIEIGIGRRIWAWVSSVWIGFGWRRWHGFGWRWRRIRIWAWVSNVWLSFCWFGWFFVVICFLWFC